MIRQRGWMIGAMLLASLAGGAASTFFLTARLGAQGGDVVTASQVNLVDRDGRLRGVLAAEDERGMASLAFYGPDGVVRGVVGAEPDGTPLLRFNNPAGVTRLSARVRDDDPVLAVGDEAARSVVIGTLGGIPIVDLLDREGTRLRMTVGDQGEPRISLFNTAGQRVVGVVASSDDASFLYLWDASGAQRVTMGAVQGSAVVNLGDGTRPRLVLGVADDGRASVEFYDAEGTLERVMSADNQP